MRLSSKADLLWNQTGPQRWERDTDEVENFYTTLARRFQGTGRAFFAMTAHIAFSVPQVHDPMESTDSRVMQALQKAWMRIRYDHPTIASWVFYQEELGKCRKAYESLPDSDDSQLYVWLKETFRVVVTSQSGQEWCNADPPVPRLPTVFLLKHPKSDCYDLVLRSQHDIIDGVGSLHLLNNIFSHASVAFDNPDNFHVPKFGNEWRNLSPPFRVAASIPISLTQIQRDRIDRMVNQNASLRTQLEIATIPFKPGPTVPGRHQRACLKLDSNRTQQLLSSCKAIGASVTHVYHAALALVLRDIQERRSEERTVRYINYALINERDRCQHPYNTSAHAVSVYHSVSGQSLVVDLVAPASSDNSQDGAPNKVEFLWTVDQIKAYYLAIRSDKDHVILAPSYWAISTPPYPAGPGAPEVPPPNKAPSVSISSLGVIDSIISPKRGCFELEDPWVTGEELGTGLGLFLGTFRGSMCLSIAYNDAWHTEDYAMNFIERCNELVLQCLEV